MVEDKPSSAPTSSNDRPFALRSTIYTIGFLLVILGVIPSLFHLAGAWLTAESDNGIDAAAEIRRFWSALRGLVGLALFSMGLAAYIFCSAWLIFFGKGPHVEFDPPKVFVATGPYRWVRNPVVITLLVTALGEAVYLNSIGIAALVLLGIGFAHWQVTRVEEPRLKARFGESYAAYCRTVNRWIPKPPIA